MFKCDVYTQLLVDQTQNDFWVFYMFLKVVYAFVCLEFLSKMFISYFYQKTLSEEFSRVTSSCENEDGKFRKHWNSYREFRDCLTSKIY